MKRVYPIILTPDDEMFLVNVPDFDVMTQENIMALATQFE